jgi:hypothetical protein
MTQPPRQGISRQGLDEAFAADEARKSELLLAARLLQARGQDEAAAAQLAQAAVVEEHLSERCLALGLQEKAWVHRFSAASCWAQAGNFYQALAWCDELLAQTELPERLRQRVQDYADRLRSRRAQWYTELALATTGSEG